MKLKDLSEPSVYEDIDKGLTTGIQHTKSSPLREKLRQKYKKKETIKKPQKTTKKPAKRVRIIARRGVLEKLTEKRLKPISLPSKKQVTVQIPISKLRKNIFSETVFQRRSFVKGAKPTFFQKGRL